MMRRFLLIGLAMAAFSCFAQYGGTARSPYTAWNYKFKNSGADAVFICDGFTIEMPDRNFNTTGSGAIVIAGPDRLSGAKSLGDSDRRLTWEYFNTVTTVNLLGTSFQIVDNGKSLQAGGKTYSLTGERPIFELDADGVLRLKED
jgi:hypothetical protein